VDNGEEVEEHGEADDCHSQGAHQKAPRSGSCDDSDMIEMYLDVLCAIVF
jgi:hypothetical protein